VVAAICFDIITDVLSMCSLLFHFIWLISTVASIPVVLLWNVRLALQQKMGIAILLSLSLVMVAVEIARLNTIYLKGQIDGVAIVFWQQQESAIAVTVFSLTSYPSFFSARKKGEKHAAKKPAQKLPQKQRKPALFSKRSNQELEMKGLPPIPWAALTRLRILFRGSGAASNNNLYTDEKEVVSAVMEQRSWWEGQKQNRITKGAFLDMTTVSDEFASSGRTLVSDHL
jgi:hypothetical protein